MGIGCQVWPPALAAMKYCHHRQKQLWDNLSPWAWTPLSRLSSVIPWPLSTPQYWTLKLYKNPTGWPPPQDNFVKKHALCHLKAVFDELQITQIWKHTTNRQVLCLFSRNLYCQFFLRKLMSILHIVRTDKKNRGNKYRCSVLYLYSTDTREWECFQAIVVSWKIHDMLLSFFLWAIIQFTPTPIKWMFQSSFVTLIVT